MERKIGDVATRLLFENEKVKVWEMLLEPGEETAIHEHKNDYLIIELEGDRIAAVPEPDTKGLFNQYVEAPIEPGHVIFVPKGGIERAVNVGNKRYREILVELK